MMKTKMLAGIAALALLAASPQLSGVPIVGASPAAAQSVSVSFNLFYDRLEPHGVWVRHSRHNYVWCPTGVDARWRPYTNGRWIYLADYGWYFQSQEPFSWATYHYGRWYVDADLGWCWVPGTKWAPAWVSWRRGGDVVGWAPLPPERDGFSVSIEIGNVEVPEDRWFFVPVRRFVEPDLRASIIFVDDQPDLLTQTEYVGPVVVQNNIVVNNVIDIDFIQEQTGQEVQVLEVEAAAEPTEVAAEASGTISIFAADIEEPTEDAAPPEAVEPEEAAAVIEEEGGTIAAAGTPDAEAGFDAEAGAEGEVTATEPDAEAAGEAALEADAEADATGEAITDAEPDAAAEAEAEAEAEAAADAEAQAPADEADAVEEQAGEAVNEAEPEAAAEEPATEEPAAEQPAADEPLVEEPAAEPVTEEPVAEEPAAPAEEPAAEEAAPEEPVVEEQAPAAVEPPCPPELLVDGVCVTPEQAAAPAAEAPPAEAPVAEEPEAVPAN